MRSRSTDGSRIQKEPHEGPPVHRERHIRHRQGHIELQIRPKRERRHGRSKVMTRLHSLRDGSAPTDVMAYVAPAKLSLRYVIVGIPVHRSKCAQASKRIRPIRSCGPRGPHAAGFMLRDLLLKTTLAQRAFPALRSTSVPAPSASQCTAAVCPHTRTATTETQLTSSTQATAAGVLLGRQSLNWIARDWWHGLSHVCFGHMTWMSRALLRDDTCVDIAPNAPMHDQASEHVHV
jgi:hypothetical protein